MQHMHSIYPLASHREKRRTESIWRILECTTLSKRISAGLRWFTMTRKAMCSAALVQQKNFRSGSKRIKAHFFHCCISSKQIDAKTDATTTYFWRRRMGINRKLTLVGGNFDCQYEIKYQESGVRGIGSSNRHSDERWRSDCDKCQASDDWRAILQGRGTQQRVNDRE